ncbi:hypothetical protein MRX96_019838 [Rhipicephalus microplus]
MNTISRVLFSIWHVQRGNNCGRNGNEVLFGGSWWQIAREDSAGDRGARRVGWACQIGAANDKKSPGVRAARQLGRGATNSRRQPTDEEEEEGGSRKEEVSSVRLEGAAGNARNAAASVDSSCLLLLPHPRSAGDAREPD